MNHLNDLDITEKLFDIGHSNKFFYISAISLRAGIIKFTFTSAKNQYRGDLIDKNTGRKRANPKTLTEGEEELTHGVIDTNNNASNLVLEKNGNGVSINNIIEYLNHFYTTFRDRKNFAFRYNVLIRTDFLSEINGLNRVTSAKMVVNKSILGSGTLNYSNRTANVNNELEIKIKAKRTENIREAAIDIYNMVANGNSPINRIIIEGVDDHQQKVVLDSFDAYKKETVNFPTNTLTGVVQTQQAYTILQRHLIEFN